MSFTPITNLQATPDFSNFQFRSETSNGFIDRRVLFCGQKGGQIYQVEFKNCDPGINDDPSWPLSDEFLDVALTLLLIIEIYSDRYPKRILRLSPDNQIEARLFSIVTVRFKYLLATLFLIVKEEDSTEIVFHNQVYYTIQIKRKPLPFFSLHTIESNWCGHSRIFKNDYKIGLEMSVRIGLAIPKASKNRI